MLPLQITVLAGGFGRDPTSWHVTASGRVSSFVIHNCQTFIFNFNFNLIFNKSFTCCFAATRLSSLCRLASLATESTASTSELLWRGPLSANSFEFEVPRLPPMLTATWHLTRLCCCHHTNSYRCFSVLLSNLQSLALAFWLAASVAPPTNSSNERLSPSWLSTCYRCLEYPWSSCLSLTSPIAFPILK